MVCEVQVVTLQDHLETLSSHAHLVSQGLIGLWILTFVMARSVKQETMTSNTHSKFGVFLEKNLFNYKHLIYTVSSILLSILSLCDTLSPSLENIRLIEAGMSSLFPLHCGAIGNSGANFDKWTKPV